MMFKSIPISFGDYKELQGKFATALIMLKNDGINFTSGEVIDFIDLIPYSQREKLLLAMHAGDIICKINRI